MKAIRAILVLGLFVFLGFGVQAQNSIRRLNKNEVKSNMAPQKTQASFQVQKETPKVKEPAPANPIPTPYPNASGSSSSKGNSESSTQYKAAPNTKSKHSIQLTPQQTEEMNRKRKEDYQK